ncbi:hypothetical protein ART_3028 [Arthrobacter sp. PAMC 25486]|uniref:hypothetical protein n=1 Tax=Arthrobacter sp. PAMC 25486 TaxID=1494608 RepID=UPI000535F236|nr:hypothetical protein [Arthrobacter sp. PAMC 25486]AIY02627.1 hypothetical protein ART_3028 [Arthrobacter sp. PAMC 25486]
MNESSKANDHGTPEQPADAAPESVEPEITAPELGAAQISEDVAETVDLKAAAAEAAAVEHEAKLAALGVSTDLGTPDAGAAAASAAASPLAPEARQPDVEVPAAEVPAPETAAEVPDASDVAATQVPEAPTVDIETAGAVAEETVQAPDDKATAGIPDSSAAPDAPTPDTAVPGDEAPGEESAVEPSEEGQSAGGDALEGGTASKEPGHIGPGIADGHGWRRPETKWEQSSTPWKPKGESWQSPSQISRNAADAAAEAAAAGTGDVAGSTLPAIPAAAVTPAIPAGTAPAAASAAKAPDTPQTSAGSTQTEGNPKKIMIVAGIALVGLALLVAFIMLLVGLFSGDGKNGAAPISSDSSLAQQSLVSSNATSGADSDLIVAEVSPLNWLEGDCLRDFQDTSTVADVVLCSSPHNAQLVGTFYYDLDEAFPGVPELKAKAAQVCKGVQFTSEASALKTLKQTTAYPSESTWKDKADRRVDCMVHDTRAGNPLTLSLTQ